jgi:hypothetical protein
LFLGDVTEIQGVQLNMFLAGYSTFVAGTTVTENANFNVTSGVSRQYNVTTGASAITATLPGTQPPPTWWTWIKKVDAGAGTVVTSPVIGLETITLAALNDLALIWSDGSNYYAKFFPAGAGTGASPYGTAPADITQEHPDEQAWATFGDPTNWAVSVAAYMTAASASITVPWVPTTWAVGTLLGVTNAGPSGGILGGQSAYPNGVPIISIVGNVITLAETTDISLTYPLTAGLVRWVDTATVVGKYSYGDGIRILAMTAQQGQMVSYRDGSIEIVRFLGVTGTPFAFRNKYVGKNTPGPLFGDCVISVNGNFDLYPTAEGNFYGFDGLTQPLINQVCDNAKDLFFGNLVSGYSPWAVDNPLTKEIWIFTGSTGMAYDYLYSTASEIDTNIDAACFCWKPGSTDKWFVLGIQQQAGGSNVYTYALVGKGGTPIVTYFRDGVFAACTFTAGLISMGDQNNEKVLVSYTPLVSSTSQDTQITIDLYGTYAAAAAPMQLMVPSQILPDPDGNGWFTTVYSQIYFQDQITVTDTRDVDLRLSGRQIEFNTVYAGGVTRQNTG